MLATMQKLLHNLLLQYSCEAAPDFSFDTAEQNELLSQVPFGLFCCAADQELKFFKVSPGFLQLSGYTQTEFTAETDGSLLSFVDPSDRKRVQQRLASPSPLPDSKSFFRYRIVARDHSIKWLLQETLPKKDSAGKCWHLAAVLDITHFQDLQKTQKLFLSCISRLNSTEDFTQMLHHILSDVLDFYKASRISVFEYDAENKTLSNTHEICESHIAPQQPSLQRLPQASGSPWLQAFQSGQNLLTFQDLKTLPEDQQKKYTFLCGPELTGLLSVPIRSGDSLYGFLNLTNPSRNCQRTVFLISLARTLSNELEKHKLSCQLHRLSFFDHLTQFNNRNSYSAFLDHVSSATLSDVGVVFADLNSLKYMNDNYGHEYGDRLLRHMAEVLRRHFSDQQIFRISGDEFVIICQNCPQPLFQNTISLLQKDMAQQTEELASIGYTWQREVSNLPEMVYRAEQMMYQNKQLYHESNPTPDGQRSRLVQIFLDKLRRDRFVFYLQPQIRLSDRTIIGAEALSRRITSDGQVLLPYDFIPFLEKEGLISELDFYIFKQVCQTLQDWKKRRLPLPVISVNFSGHTLLQKDFTTHLIDLCTRYEVDPTRIVIEISRMSKRLERSRLKELIYTLQVHGIRIRIKNLTMENDFPSVMTLDGVHSIKLDLSLIREMEGHYRTQQLIRALIDLCHRMGQSCMASGVETENQADLLASMGCDSIQGFLTGRPMEVSEFEQTFLSVPDSEKLFCDPPGSLPQKMSPPQLSINISTLDSTVFELLSLSSDHFYFYISDLSSDFSRWSPSAVQYFGLPGEYLTSTKDTWSTYIHPDDQKIFLEDMGRIFSGQSNRHLCEYRARNAQGEYVWVQCSGIVLRNPDGTPGLFAGTMMNLRSASKFDPITGLLSSYTYQEDFQKLLDDNESGVLLLFGIDHFKRINDVYGYQAGDQILRYLGQQVQLIPGCVFYRMDGDKIACIYRQGTAANADSIYRQVCRIFNEIPDMKGRNFQLTVSCGAVFFPLHGKKMESLRANAEYALEQAKKAYRSNLAFYSEDLHRESLLSFHLQEMLRQSIANHCRGFSLLYQPQVDPKTNRIWGAEALLRFTQPKLPAIPPDRFIPILEETGGINEVGAWVLHNALAQCALWRKYLPDFRISVNASYVQMMRKDFRQTVLQALESHHLPPQALILELTESCKIVDPERLQEDVHFFTSQNIQVALDDFGTGYSSISLLRELTPAWIKIDHSFVASITKNRIDRAIIEYILELCHHAQIQVCVEGIENEEILQIISSFKPDLLQGYYFSRPLDVSNFEQCYIHSQSGQIDP